MTDLKDAARQALEAHANRYQVVRDGYWWRVKIGDGTQTVGQHHTETGALRLASELHRAFNDGGFVVQEALRAALEQPNECHWYQDGDEDSDKWAASCGRHRYFQLNDGTPTDNRMKHCCYCGKPLVEVPIEPEDNHD
jgi:hypothetical protein